MSKVYTLFPLPPPLQNVDLQLEPPTANLRTEIPDFREEGLTQAES